MTIILYFKFIKNIYFLHKLFFSYYFWGLGIGDWGLGIGDWAQSPLNFL
jgi:hypothetical protein